MAKKEKTQLKALKAITALRQLDALNMLTEEQKISIEGRIMLVYGKFLSPLREKTS